MLLSTVLRVKVTFLRRPILIMWINRHVGVLVYDSCANNNKMIALYQFSQCTRGPNTKAHLSDGLFSGWRQLKN